MLVERFAASPVGTLVPINGIDARFNEHYEHWAFVPHPLPEEVELSARTWALVAEAMLSIGRLDQAGRQIPNPSLLRRPTLRREAQSTSALEGTYAPLTDVLAVDPDDAAQRSPELREVLNYVRAAEHAYEAVPDRPLTLQLLMELHQLLVAGTASDGREAGKVRSHQVVIGSAASRVRDARFVPPPPGHDLVAGLRAWVDWVNRPHPALPPVVAAALAHYQFETLHVFNDGNGRIGRLAIVLHLMLAGALREPLLTVSPWFEARRRDYQDGLQHVSETGDWDRWAAFFAAALRDRADDSTRTINELVAVRDRAKELCRTENIRGIALDVAEGLIARPIVTPTWVQHHYGVSYPTANNAVARLEQLGLLRETTGGAYGRVFAADAVLRILER
ncbi:MAG: Fic family protein [Acidimicrobiales bacterium]